MPCRMNIPAMNKRLSQINQTIYKEAYYEKDTGTICEHGV